MLKKNKHKNIEEFYTSKNGKRQKKNFCFKNFQYYNGCHRYQQLWFNSGNGCVKKDSARHREFLKSRIRLAKF